MQAQGLSHHSMRSALQKAKRACDKSESLRKSIRTSGSNREGGLERGRENVCERERESVFVCVCERESVCVSVSV